MIQEFISGIQVFVKEIKSLCTVINKSRNFDEINDQ